MKYYCNFCEVEHDDTTTLGEWHKIFKTGYELEELNWSWNK